MGRSTRDVVRCCHRAHGFRLFQVVCAIALTASFIGPAIGTTRTPTPSSNYGVSTGMVSYLPSYTDNNPRMPYGVLNGRVLLTRMASGATHLSVSLWVERFSKMSTVPPGSPLYAYIHDGPCSSKHGGSRLQNPYVCGDGGCSEDEVNAWNGTIPLEYKLLLTTARVDGSNLVSATGEWGVHIPEEVMRSGVSAVIYDPFTQSAMACAPLELDRDMDGFTYRANDELVDTRPLVSLKITRQETGYSIIDYSLSGLKAMTTYLTRLHVLPCVAGASNVSPGPAYFRDPSCNDAGSTDTAACGNTEAAQVWIGQGHTTSKFGAMVGKQLSIPSLLRADAQSVVIHACVQPGTPEAVPDGTGLCRSGTMAAAVCIDLLNDVPELMTTAAPLDETEEPVDTTQFYSTTMFAASTFDAPPLGQVSSSITSTSFRTTITSTTSPAPTSTTPEPADETTEVITEDGQSTQPYKCASNVAIVGKADVSLPNGDIFALGKTRTQCGSYCSRNAACAAFVFQDDDGLEYQHMDGYCELWSVAGLQVAPSPHAGAVVCIKMAESASSTTEAPLLEDDTTTAASTTLPEDSTTASTATTALPEDSTTASTATTAGIVDTTTTSTEPPASLSAEQPLVRTTVAAEETTAAVAAIACIDDASCKGLDSTDCYYFVIPTIFLKMCPALCGLCVPEVTEQADPITTPAATITTEEETEETTTAHKDEKEEKMTTTNAATTNSDGQGNIADTTTVAAATKLPPIEDNRKPGGGDGDGDGDGDGGGAPSTAEGAEGQCPSMEYLAHHMLWDQKSNHADDSSRSRRTLSVPKDASTMKVGAKKGKKEHGAKLHSTSGKKSKSAKTSLLSLYSHDLSSVATEDGGTACCLPAAIPASTMSFYVENGAAIRRLQTDGKVDGHLLRNVSLGAASCVILMVGLILLAVQRPQGWGGDLADEYSPKLSMGEPAERQHQRLLGMDGPLGEYAIPDQPQLEPRRGDAAARLLHDRYNEMYSDAAPGASFQSVLHMFSPSKGNP